MAVGEHDVATELRRPAAREETTGAEALVACLERRGVEVMFGLCGHTNVAVLDALSNSSIRFIGVRHEQIAAHAADGYFRMTHKPAAVLTTIGPGLANALTGVADARLDASAMIVISGNVPTYYTGLDAFQELNEHAEAQQADMFRPVVKRAWRIPHRSVVVDYMARAFNVATSGRPGPVLVDVPMDILSEPWRDNVDAVESRNATSRRVNGDPAEIARAADLLAHADRPLIYAGGGAILSEAQSQVTRLAERLRAPVVTTLSGQGAIDTDHPLWGGYTATVGLPFAHRLVNEADVVLVLGSQLTEMETSSWSSETSFRVPPARIIQVDLEPTIIGRAYPVSVGIQGDVAAVVEQLLAQLPPDAPPDTAASARLELLTIEKEAWRKEIAACAAADERPITVERLLRDIRAALPRDGIFLTDVGIRHQVAQQFGIYAQMTHYVTSGWGTMGGAVAAALGAKVGRPAVPVVAEVGDGAFTAALSAVITAVEHAIPVTWVVMNNYGYKSIGIYQAKHDLARFGTDFEDREGRPYNPDFAELARACGALGRRVEDPTELRPALEEAIASGVPYVLDVVTEPRPKTRATGYWDVNAILSGDRFTRPRD